MSKFVNAIFYIFDFCKDLTCANDSYTQTQTHTHTVYDMAMAIGKSTDLPKNDTCSNCNAWNVMQKLPTVGKIAFAKELADK